MKYIFFFLLFPFILSAQLPDSLISIVNYTGLPNGISVRDIVVTQSNAKYLATNKGLYKVVNKSAAAEKLKDGDFQALCTNRKEDVWAIEGQKVHSLDEVIFEIFDPVVGSSMIYHKGSLLIGTDNGVYKINIKTQKRTGLYRENNTKLLSNKINFVFADPEDEIWIGTDKGLAKINKKDKWKIYEKDLVMESMTYNKEGLWLVTDKEMWVIDPYGRWYPAALNKGLKEGMVRDITTDKDGRLILASNALVRYNPYIDEIHSYSSTLGFVSQQCNAIEGDANQDIWIGTENNGLYLLSFGDTKTVELSGIIEIEEKISCKGSNRAVISAKAFGGAPPYKFSWNDGDYKGKRLTNIGKGKYTVTITDKNSNVYTDEVTLINPYPLNLKFDEIKGITVAGEKDGIAKINISGGVPPYSFRWEDESTLQERTDLRAGIHNVTITDADGCLVVTEFEVPAEKFIPQLDVSTLAIGQTLKLDKLFFQADSSAIEDDFMPVLDEIYSFLKSNESVVVEIGGHTNSKPPADICYRLSTARAKNIAEYLYRKGIPSDRISYKGYGKEQPIADNKTLAGRKKNQRVELKILSI